MLARSNQERCFLLQAPKHVFMVVIEKFDEPIEIQKDFSNEWAWFMASIAFLENYEVTKLNDWSIKPLKILNLSIFLVNYSIILSTPLVFKGTVFGKFGWKDTRYCRKFDHSCSNPPIHWLLNCPISKKFRPKISMKHNSGKVSWKSRSVTNFVS